MTLFEARLLKLQVVALLRQAGYAQNFPLYVKTEDRVELEVIQSRFSVARVFCAFDFWPVQGLVSASDLDDRVTEIEAASDIAKLVDGTHSCSNSANRFVAEIDEGSLPRPDTSELTSSLKALEAKLKARSGLAKKLQWSVGLFLRPTGNYAVTVKIMSGYSLGRNAPLSEIARKITLALGLSDFGSIDVTNPVTPMSSSSLTEWSKKAHDTARPGVEVSTPGIGASSLCVHVRRKNSDERFFLASGHGLFSASSRSNAVEVMQPNGGRVIGIAQRSTASYFKNHNGEIAADYSLVEVSDDFASDNRFDEATRRKAIVGIVAAENDMDVLTLGAASGLIERKIKTFEAETNVIFEDGKIAVCLDQLISVGDKSSRTKSGDSGGPVLVRKLDTRNDFEIVGMIIAGHALGAGNRRRFATVITPFETICALANVELEVA